MKTILIVILATSSLALAGVLGWQRLGQLETIPIAVNQPPVNQPIATTPEETAGWQTYQLYDGALEIKYPENQCNVFKNPEGSGPDFEFSITCSNVQVYTKRVLLEDLNWEKSINSFDPIDEMNLKIIASQYTTLAGKKALRQVYQSIDKNHEHEGVYIYVQAPETFTKDSQKFLIKFTYYTRISGLGENLAGIALIEKILSTIKFTK